MKTGFKILIITTLLLFCTMVGCQKELSDFEKGLRDARESKPYEINSLISLNADDQMVEFSKDYTKVLLASFNYVQKDKVYPSDEVWCVSEKELFDKCNELADEISVSRLKQLLGLREYVRLISVTTFWISIDLVYRPSYQPDPKKQLDSSDFDLSSLGTYTDWFKQMAKVAFASDTSFIWTKLGYTYDLATIGNRYGLTQFVVSDTSKMDIVDSKNIEDYLSTF